MAAANSRTASSNANSASFFGNSDLSSSRALACSTFLAGDEFITIIPSFSLSEPLELISGDVGPFRAGMDAVVPLWLAVMLRRRKLAQIVPPDWMDVDVLKEVLRFERDLREQSFSADLPFRHAEIARAILAACRAGSGTGSAAGDAGGDSEIPNADQVKLLLEDIASVRLDKIRRNVHQLSASTLRQPQKTESIIDVTNIGSLEMHTIKPFVTEAFRLHRELSGKGSSYSQDAEGGGAPPGSTAGRGGGRAAGERAGRGRLLQSRLARESAEAEEGGEELADPRPTTEGGGEASAGQGDEELARSSLRRHR